MKNLNDIYRELVQECIKKSDELKEALSANETLPLGKIAHLHGEIEGLRHAIRIVLDADSGVRTP